MEQRQQVYELDRKIVSIHSEDRNIDKWPNPNNFEVTLPQDFLNVQSIRLVNVNFPSVIYTFSNEYQNTKFRFKLIPHTTNTAIKDNLEQKLNNPTNPNDYFEVEINEGTYDPEQLAFELTQKMNRVVSDYLGSPYDKFVVRANTVNYKILIGNTCDEPILLFNQKIDYTLSCNQKIVWDQPIKWGLPYFLGFNKQEIQSISYEEFYVDYDGDDTPWLEPSTDSSINKVWVAQSNHTYQLLGENELYIELDNHNSITELTPYPRTLNNNTQFIGETKSAFAKISIFNPTSAQIFDSRNGFLTNLTHYTRPIERIRKMKFKVRFHDGRLVDFKNREWGMTIEINQLIDKPLYRMNIQQPQLYRL